MVAKKKTETKKKVNKKKAETKKKVTKKKVNKKKVEAKVEIPKDPTPPVYTIKIIKGDVQFEILRSNLIEIKETGDGIVFNLRQNVHITIIDMMMPIETKKAVFNSVNAFTKADMTINLLNYHQPVSVQSK